MWDSTTRRTVPLIAAVCVALMTGCATTTAGTATTADQAPDGGAIVALMDTGDYATAASRPFGTAGDNSYSGALLEAHRIADYTVGPWQIDAEINTLPAPVNLSLVGPIASTDDMTTNHIFDPPVAAAAGANGFVSGFATVRTTPPAAKQQRSLQNVVLRFPDPGAATAAATQMAATFTPWAGSTPPQPVALTGLPETIAVTFTMPDQGQRVVGFTPHGAYVFYTVVQVSDYLLGADAGNLSRGIIDLQKKWIDQFTATDLPALKDLPLDPTGQLLAKTLVAPDNRAPFLQGIWKPRGWLHFALDPVKTVSLFSTAGVDQVAQRLTTVYQAANPDGAVRVADGLAEQIGSFATVHGIDGVRGLPAAKCYQRTVGLLPATAPITWQRVQWAFSCVATVDRYAYTAFSTTADDARQQMGAQYRILAGQ